MFRGRATGRFELDRAELLDVEESVAAEMVVAFGVVRVDAIGLDDELEPAIGRIGVVQDIAARRLAKEAIGVAQAAVADAEHDRRVSWVDDIRLRGQRER